MIRRPFDAIVRDAAPVHAADVAGNDQRSLQRRRREESIGPQLAHRLAAPRAVLVRHAPCLVGLQRRARERSRRRREGLRRRRFLARDVALRHGALLDGNQRRACLTVEDEQMPGLRGDARRREPSGRPCASRTGSAATRRRSPRCRDGPSGNARRARRYRRAARRPSRQTGCGRAARRRSSRGSGCWSARRPGCAPGSATITDQALEEPVRPALLFFQVSAPTADGFCGTGSQLHFCFPVSASKPRTSPLGCGSRAPSAIADPTTIVSPITAGGDVTW